MSTTLEKGQTINFYQATAPIIISVFAIGLVGHSSSGKVMTWNGITMYAGIAMGAPISIWLSKEHHTLPAFLLIALLPLVSWLSNKLVASYLNISQETLSRLKSRL